MRLTALCEGEQPACEISGPVTVIGSRRDCSLSIPHPQVSKLHCALIHTGQALLVCDLRSRMGTFVDDKPVEWTRLHPGSRLRVGDVEVQYEFDPPPERTASDDELLLHEPITLVGGESNLEIRGPLALIGRRNTCEVVVDDPNVSLVHAVIFSLMGEPAVADLGSRSGTIVNGQPETLAWLTPGDVLSIADNEFAVSPDRATPRVPTQPQPQVQPQPAMNVEAPACVAALSPTAELTFDNLGEFMASLQGQMATARAKFDQRAQKLGAREAALREREDALNAERATIGELNARIEKRGVEVEQAMLLAEAREKELELRAHTLTAAQGELDEARRVVEEKEAQLEERVKQINEREATIVQREQEEAEAIKRLEQFRTALRQASQAFASYADSMTPGDGEAGADGVDLSSLPAPIVNGQMFAAPDTGRVRPAAPQQGN